jgi:major vault protein
MADAETHIPDVYEQIVGEVKITSLTNRQYCVVLDPWKHGKQLLGQRELRKGEVSFFLNPGERLENGIQNIYILGEEEALLLKAKENYFENDKKSRKLERNG